MSVSLIEKKIYYHDTDCGGVVYYANYLEYLEEGRSQYCLTRGIKLKELAESGIYFVVAHTEINYKAPARYQDTVNVITSVEKAGNSTIYFLQKVTRGDIVLAEAKTTWVQVGKDFKSQPINPETKQAFLIT